MDGPQNTDPVALVTPDHDDVILDPNVAQAVLDNAAAAKSATHLPGTPGAILDPKVAKALESGAFDATMARDADKMKRSAGGHGERMTEEAYKDVPPSLQKEIEYARRHPHDKGVAQDLQKKLERRGYDTGKSGGIDNHSGQGSAFEASPDEQPTDGVIGSRTNAAMDDILGHETPHQGGPHNSSHHGRHSALRTETGRIHHPEGRREELHSHKKTEYKGQTKLTPSQAMKVLSS